ncbi:DNA repair protein XRCC4 [Platanthera zijinensis]|uniref:DNA repair protein XRCC4 n=1 Tax=Platanthera zijinensis TaxID=2320716 RepID=A0AAP0BFJ4_9ASPA
MQEEVVRKTQSFEKLKVEAERCLLQSQTFCNEKSEFESAAYAKVKNEQVVFPIVHSEDAAYAMYCDYAHRTGFSVRKQHLTYWTHTRIIKWREYSCSKAGVKIKKSSPKKYRKLDTRTGCLACIFFSTDKDGKNWTVSKFVEKHNHPLVPEKEQHLLRSHRNISNMQGKRVDAKKKAIIVDDGEPKAKKFNFLSGSTNEPPSCNIPTLIRCLDDSIEPLERLSQGQSEP